MNEIKYAPALSSYRIHHLSTFLDVLSMSSWCPLDVISMFFLNPANQGIQWQLLTGKTWFLLPTGATIMTNGNAITLVFKLQVIYLGHPSSRFNEILNGQKCRLINRIFLTMNNKSVYEKCSDTAFRPNTAGVHPLSYSSYEYKICHSQFAEWKRKGLRTKEIMC